MGTTTVIAGMLQALESSKFSCDVEALPNWEGLASSPMEFSDYENVYQF